MNRKECKRKWSRSNLMHYPNMCVERLRKTTVYGPRFEAGTSWIRGWSSNRLTVTVSDSYVWRHCIRYWDDISQPLMVNVRLTFKSIQTACLTTLVPRSRALHATFTDMQLFKEFPNILYSYNPKIVTVLQQPSIHPKPEPDESSTHLQPF
jgi:hypothetical protein